MNAQRPLRVAVYADNWCQSHPDGVYEDRSLVVFIAGLATAAEHTVLLGQLDSGLTRAHYRVPDEVDFVGLPSYPSMLTLQAPLAMLGSLRRFWRVLGEVDVVWLLGPHPLCVALAALASVRGRRVALGVRQDFPAYVRSRHPERRIVHLAGDLLELSYRLLARRCPTVVVGPELARNYSRARRLLSICVSLVRDSDIADAGESARRSWDGRRTVLTVGRLETEKNPPMLADVLGRLDGSDWRLLICGEGPLAGELRARLRELGVEDRAEVLGYLPIHGGLLDRYRAAHAFLHVSWTDGMPQALLEAFASGTPVVATAVGGVPEAAGDAALLVPPGDPEAAARALERLAADPVLRGRLVAAGFERLRGRTLEGQSALVAQFLADPS